MKISSSFDNTNNKCSKQSFKAGIPKKQVFLPNAVGTAGKVVNDYIGVPEQKLFMAATALIFVPMIDMMYADEDKKVDSAIKSASKAIAGGITGVTIRALAIKLFNDIITLDNITDKANPTLKDKIKMVANKFLLPPKAILDKEEAKKIGSAAVQAAQKLKIEKQLKQYNQTLGTLVAIIVMSLFTNSKIDVPLTSDLIDLISGVVKDKKSWGTSFNEVTTARKNKIKQWFENKKAGIKKTKAKATKIFNIMNDKNPSGTKEGRSQ